MQQIDDDISDPRKISFQALHTRFLAESGFENMAQKLRYISQVGGIHVDCRESAAGDIELVA